jgi:hypothetical protein
MGEGWGEGAGLALKDQQELTQKRCDFIGAKLAHTRPVGKQEEALDPLLVYLLGDAVVTEPSGR